MRRPLRLDLLVEPSETDEVFHFGFTSRSERNDIHAVVFIKPEQILEWNLNEIFVRFFRIADLPTISGTLPLEPVVGTRPNIESVGLPDDGDSLFVKGLNIESRVVGRRRVLLGDHVRARDDTEGCGQIESSEDIINLVCAGWDRHGDSYGSLAWRSEGRTVDESWDEDFACRCLAISRNVADDSIRRVTIISSTHRVTPIDDIFVSAKRSLMPDVICLEQKSYYYFIYAPGDPNR